MAAARRSARGLVFGLVDDDDTDGGEQQPVAQVAAKMRGLRFGLDDDDGDNDHYAADVRPTRQQRKVAAMRAAFAPVAAPPLRPRAPAGPTTAAAPASAPATAAASTATTKDRSRDPAWARSHAPLGCVLGPRRAQIATWHRRTLRTGAWAAPSEETEDTRALDAVWQACTYNDKGVPQLGPLRLVALAALLPGGSSLVSFAGALLDPVLEDAPGASREAHTLARAVRVQQWLASHLEPWTAQAGQGLEAVFRLVASRRIGDACGRAVALGEHRLAVLLAAAPLVTEPPTGLDTSSWHDRIVMLAHLPVLPDPAVALRGLPFAAVLALLLWAHPGLDAVDVFQSVVAPLEPRLAPVDLWPGANADLARVLRYAATRHPDHAYALVHAAQTNKGSPAAAAILELAVRADRRVLARYAAALGATQTGWPYAVFLAQLMGLPVDVTRHATASPNLSPEERIVVERARVPLELVMRAKAWRVHYDRVDHPHRAADPSADHGPFWRPRPRRADTVRALHDYMACCAAANLEADAARACVTVVPQHLLAHEYAAVLDACRHVRAPLQALVAAAAYAKIVLGAAIADAAEATPRNDLQDLAVLVRRVRREAAEMDELTILDFLEEQMALVFGVHVSQDDDARSGAAAAGGLDDALLAGLLEGVDDADGRDDDMDTTTDD